MTDVPERLSETFAALAKDKRPGATVPFAMFCRDNREAIAEALALLEDPRTARARRLLQMVEREARWYARLEGESEGMK